MWRRCALALALCACGRLEFTSTADGGDGARTADGSDGGSAERTTYVKGSMCGFYDRFGWSVALSTDGNTLAVGAPIDDGPLGISASGSVYVFVRTGDVWSEQAFLRTTNPDLTDIFGWTVALSGDGNTLAIGAPQEDSQATTIDGDETDDNATDAGAVYIFARTGTTWSQQAYIKAANAESMDLFGGAVALSDSGDVLAVGAYGEDSAETGTAGTGVSNGASGSGAAYVFTRSGTVWSPQAYLKASNTGMEDQFGFSVALSADGATLVVGAPGEDSGATTVDGAQGDGVESAGAVYSFVRSGTWSQSAYVKASTSDFGDGFGRAVAISRDGQRLVAASPGADTSELNSGAVFTFERAGASWGTVSKLEAFMPGDNDQFGVSVATTANGYDVYMGAVNEDSGASGLGGDQTNDDVSDSGALYAMSRAVSGVGWMPGFYRKAIRPGVGDNYGNAVAVNGDGHVIAVGIPWEDSAANTIDGDVTDDSRTDSGAVEITTY